MESVNTFEKCVSMVFLDVQKTNVSKCSPLTPEAALLPQHSLVSVWKALWRSSRSYLHIGEKQVCTNVYLFEKGRGREAGREGGREGGRERNMLLLAGSLFNYLQQQGHSGWGKASPWELSSGLGVTVIQ